ncbi:penicillin-binding protein activator [Roseicella aquatilis]|uniref:Penicillin-binding protein activator n=1 Tax=Roseicella aquatilis TaxID=2527868 RepID=A0A4R4DQ89_9PROT|nr:penicillin-binding protein activator [Roseicella aquatilis]TCZ64021.1 penicillin-binding protein activator [Roseicella aquatilis]
MPGPSSLAPRHPFGRWIAALLLLLPAAACAPQAPSRPVLVAPVAPGAAGPVAQEPVPGGNASGPPGVLPDRGILRSRVALLLPLSGGNRALGTAMLNAAQLALFEQGDPSIEFLPRDTGGTGSGAAEAARFAVSQGARALAGPLTLGETAAVASVARGAGTPVFAFTSDANQAGNGVWVLGLTPSEQADRMTAAAATAGAQRLGLLAADDEFGRRLAAAMRARAQSLGLPAPVVVLHPRIAEIGTQAKELANQAGPEGLDAVLLAQSGERARQAAATLAAALPSRPRFLGTALWANDATLGQEPALVGAWFPGPDPETRAGFDTRYQSTFGSKPPTLAGLAYDAAALAARTVRDGTPPVDQPMLGADGPIRLEAGGQAQRGLAIFAIDASGTPQLVEPAPVPGSPGA